MWEVGGGQNGGRKEEGTLNAEWHLRKKHPAHMGVKSKIALTRSALEISNEIKMEAKRCTITGNKRVTRLP